jgi:hypothetical protein
MKEYPSIPHCNEPPNVPAYIQRKEDGSCMRWEWSKKRGWYKFGTRHQVISPSDINWGGAYTYFQEHIAGDLLYRLGNLVKDSLIVYGEWFGPSSFAGKHRPGEPKQVKVFDVNLYKKGFISPADFLTYFQTAPYMVEFLGVHRLDNEFVEMVRSGEIVKGEAEGVICKWGEGHNLKMMKIKTRAYLGKLKGAFGADWERYL